MIAEKKRVSIVLYFLSFILPVISWIICCAINGIYPFGDKSIMTGDITYQFIDYLSYFKSIILSDNDFKYTFSKTMGGDMAGFYSYYLASPFNYLLLLFPNRNLPIGFLVMIIIKSGLMGLSFFYFISKRFGQTVEALLFSTTYALMGYIIIYYQLYAYFDSLILLPLIIHGLYKIYENPQKKLLYIVSLFSAVLINYYVGWMICIFCVLFFIYINYVNGIKIDSFKSFFISSLIAGLLSAYNLVSALLSMRGEKDNFNFGIYRNFRLLDIFSRLYPNSFKGNVSNCLPNIYCGILIVLLLVVYFTNKKICKKEKIASAIFLLFIIGNMYISIINIIWHGLNQPIGFPYRYSFLLSFMMILLSYKTYINIEEKQSIIKAMLIFIFAFILYSAYLIVRGSEVTGIKEIIISGLIILSILITVFLHIKKIISWKMALIIICILHFCEIIENQANVFNYYDLANIYDYQEYIDTVGGMINDIKSEDDSFYRIEKYFRRSHNDAMQFQYNGLSHYSSCEKKEYINYMGKLGFRDNGNWSFYDSGSTTFVDCLFGIKYVLSQFNSTGKPYENIGNKDNYYIYRNNYALPIAFISDSNISDFDMKKENNTFEFQNKIADSINGKNNNIFIPIQGINKSLHNLTEESTEGLCTYKKIDSNEDAYIEYEIPLDEKIAECYFSAPSTQKAEIWTDGGYDKDYFSQYSWNIYDIGTINDDNDKVVLWIKVLDEEIKISGEYFYYEDFDAIDNWYNEITSNYSTLNKISSSNLIGKADSKENSTLVFSIPYDKAWKVMIDGKEVKTKQVLGIFLSTDITNGSHDIELLYYPEGKKIGIMLSTVSLLLFMVVLIREKYYILYMKNFFKFFKKKC